MYLIVHRTVITNNTHMIRILSSFAIIVAAAAVVVGGTYSWFTAQNTTSVVQADSATLSLDENGFANFEFGDIVGHMAPGDKTDEVTIVIKNDGTTDLAWFGDWVFTGGNKLREALYVDYAEMKFKRPDGTEWESADNFITNGVGSGSYPSWFNTLAGLPTSPFGVVSLKSWDANNGMGSAPYEHMGALKPDYSYELTFKLGFAKDAGNEYQADVTDPVNISFKVDATQINAAALDELSPNLSNHVNWLNQQIANQN
jgi:hypothetical protein